MVRVQMRTIHSTLHKQKTPPCRQGGVLLKIKETVYADNTLTYLRLFGPFVSNFTTPPDLANSV